MKRRQLGQSGLDASVIGLGTWAIGGWMWGGQDERDAVRAIHASLDAGVNLIDTAPIYGFGHSESIVGAAIGSPERCGAGHEMRPGMGRRARRVLFQLRRAR